MDSMLVEHGLAKFPSAALLSSSACRNWSGVYAESRRHSAGELPAFTSRVTEITYALRSVPKAKVYRSGAGTEQMTPVRAGTIWICPQGVHESGTRITADLPEVLHVCLPNSVFQRLEFGEGMPPVRPETLRYVANPADPLMAQLVIAIGMELKQETSSGRLLVEAATLGLAARLAHDYDGTAPAGIGDGRPHALDTRRLRRVLDFVENNLDSDLSLEDLARVACLSQFHFSRAFRIATGSPPHRYLSDRRLQLAKSLLSSQIHPISEIALICRFSSQTSFTRAFSRVVGVSPARYRQNN